MAAAQPKPFALTPFVPEYSENDIEDRAKRYWATRGWTVIRNHVGVFRAPSGMKIKLGEPGMTDYLVVRGAPASVVWVEIKRPGEKPDPHQELWMATRRKMGFHAVWFDQLEPLAAWFTATFG